MTSNPRGSFGVRVKEFVPGESTALFTKLQKSGLYWHLAYSFNSLEQAHVSYIHQGTTPGDPDSQQTCTRGSELHHQQRLQHFTHASPLKKKVQCLRFRRILLLWILSFTAIVGSPSLNPPHWTFKTLSVTKPSNHFFQMKRPVDFSCVVNVSDALTMRDLRHV